MTKKIKFVKGEMYEYELYPFLDQYDKRLREKSEPFRFKDSSEGSRTPIIARHLAVSMIETMRDRDGVGLAAIQVGIPYRVFVMGSPGLGENAVAYAFFNPEILEVTGEEKFEEGCLTFPGLFLPITRPATVKIKYQDMNGEDKEETFSGLSARIVLHEYDHLDGIVMTSKVSSIMLDRQRAKVKKNLRLLKEQKIREEKQELIRKATEKLILEQKNKLDPDQQLAANPNKFLKITGI